MTDVKENFVEIDRYINWYGLQIIPKHTISYLEFRPPEFKDTVVCAHGLTRNAYDFYKIGQALGATYRVISISYPGRGKSGYFPNKKHYNYPVYIKDSFLLLEKLQIKNPIWLGTSMGGVIGMAMAAKFPKCFKGLILNDIGPFIPAATLVKIKKYAGLDQSFKTLQDGKDHLKMIYNQFGILEEEDWDEITKHSFIQNSDGKYIMNYDKEIIKGMNVSNSKPKDVKMWDLWRSITCPLMVIRGSKSDILNEKTVNEMKASKEFEYLEISYAGHAPALLYDDQITPIKSWIDRICKN